MQWNYLREKATRENPARKLKKEISGPLLRKNEGISQKKLEAMYPP